MALLSPNTSNVVNSETNIFLYYHFMSISLNQVFILLSLAMANEFKFVSEHFILFQVSLHACETELLSLPLSLHQPYLHRHCRAHWIEETEAVLPSCAAQTFFGILATLGQLSNFWACQECPKITSYDQKLAICPKIMGIQPPPTPAYTHTWNFFFFSANTVNVGLFFLAAAF